MLGDIDALDRFFDRTFELMAADHLTAGISVKSRIGVMRADEAIPIYEVFNRYPLREVIVHPRTTKEMYQGEPHRDVYEEIRRMSKHPLCYNGNITKPSDMDRIGEDQAVMIGRGLLRNPALVREIQGGPALCGDELFSFFREIQKGYEEEMYGDAPVLAKMKELWWYAGDLFPGADKALKKIKKAKSISEYEMAVNRLKEGLPH